LGEKHLKLITKQAEVFQQKFPSESEFIVPIILTSFNNDGDFDLSKFTIPAINNLIFKPFDKLILQQHLAQAIAGKRKPNTMVISNQKVNAKIEMLKTIYIEAIGELGFVSRSDKPVPVNSLAKYYGDFFTTSKHRSVLAICRNCIDHPKIPGQYLVFLHFFSIDNDQISHIRKKVHDKNILRFTTTHWSTPPEHKYSQLHGVVITHGHIEPTSLKKSLEADFVNLKIASFDHEARLFQALDLKNLEKEVGLCATPGLPPSGELPILLNEKRTQILELPKDLDPNFLILGFPIKDWQESFSKVVTAVIPDDQNKFKEFISHGKLKSKEKLLFTFKDPKGGLRYIEFKDAKEVNHETYGKSFSLTMVELKFEEIVKIKLESIPIFTQINFLMLDAKLLLEKGEKYWKEFEEKLHFFEKIRGYSSLEKIKILAFSTRHLTEDEEKLVGQFADDLYLFPLDKAYISRKIYSIIPDLHPADDNLATDGIVFQDFIKAITTIKITEISEAGLCMQYSRAIDSGDFREFHLLTDDVMNSHELIAKCSYSEKDQKEFKNNFTFFGMQDYDCKRIRIWIREAYVLTKKSS
jgi:hypothetical protein